MSEIDLTNEQRDALVNLYGVLNGQFNVLNGVLPGGPGMMRKVGPPLATSIEEILAAFNQCKETGLGSN